MLLLFWKQPISAAAAAKSLQSCLTLCNPIDGSPPGSSVLGILQARILEWAAISFSNAWKWKVKVKSLSRVQLLATPWTVAYQAPPPIEFSRQEYWNESQLTSPWNVSVYCNLGLLVQPHPLLPYLPCSLHFEHFALHSGSRKLCTVSHTQHSSFLSFYLQVSNDMPFSFGNSP